MEPCGSLLVKSFVCVLTEARKCMCHSIYFRDGCTHGLTRHARAEEYSKALDIAVFSLAM